MLAAQRAFGRPDVRPRAHRESGACGTRAPRAPLDRSDDVRTNMAQMLGLAPPDELTR
ncbi:hypothetical protein C7S16_5674 [Burkholderia thailandensis]|uniref:Uncharacterized protein n=1 Tax=Burkholderia thailandensis TaxID=57975 RepID=A0AAW9CL42_BURTH|nr:hypothetical protein [Burkholderia thailandensis]MDW9251370.1 hypothetical protein [Burkholderia thailandensis]